MNKLNKHITTLFLTGSLALSMAMNQTVHANELQLKKRTGAASSTDLVVDPEFNFSNSRSVVLDIIVSNDINQPQPGVLLKVYAVEDPKRLKGVKRPLKTTLLTVAISDTTGAVQREVEIPEHYRDLRIEKMVMSEDSVKQVRYKGQERIHIQL